MTVLLWRVTYKQWSNIVDVVLYQSISVYVTQQKPHSGITLWWRGVQASSDI